MWTGNGEQERGMFDRVAPFLDHYSTEVVDSSRRSIYENIVKNVTQGSLQFS